MSLVAPVGASCSERQKDSLANRTVTRENTSGKCEVKAMSTWREIMSWGHPFFERMGTLQKLFDMFEGAVDTHGGALQDAEIEFLHRAHRGPVGDDEGAFFDGAKIEWTEMRAMLRLSQIVLLYSTFESLCKGNLQHRSSDWCVNEAAVGRAEKRKKSGKRRTNKRNQPTEQPPNLIVAILEEAEKEGMKSDVWPACRNHIEVLVRLRNHLVHTGLDVNEKLREKLRPFVESVDEFPGSTVEEKLDCLGKVGWVLDIPRAYSASLLRMLKQLGAALIILQDSELPEFDTKSVSDIFDSWPKSDMEGN